MRIAEDLNMNLYPAYIAEVLYSGEPVRGVPDYRHLLAPGYEPGAYRIPDADNVTVVAKGKFEARVSIPVGSYVWAVSGYSEKADGYRVKIVDLGTGTPFWGQRIDYHLASGAGQTIAGGAFALVMLDKPRLVIEPGLLSVQVENLSGSTNQIQFVIHTAEPRS